MICDCGQDGRRTRSDAKREKKECHMADESRIPIPAEIDNESIRAFVEEWAEVTDLSLIHI